VTDGPQELKGTFRKYRDHNFRPETRLLIGQINSLISEYDDMGMKMSVRQIFYQLVGIDQIDNDDREYERISKTISNARMAGLISWDAIEDRNRNLAGLRTWRHPKDALEEAHTNYRLNWWENQHYFPEVWVEKAAQEGTVGQICDELQVNFLALRGYNSQSEQWAAAQRFRRAINRGQTPIVFHLGDHDYSGMDMTRDNRDRLEIFCGTPIIVQRLALNMNQIEEFNPPPNMGKSKDSRKEDYFKKFKTYSTWELDALKPTIIKDLIKDAIMRIRDEDKWDETLAREVCDKREIAELLEQYGTDDHENA